MGLHCLVVYLDGCVANSRVESKIKYDEKRKTAAQDSGLSRRKEIMAEILEQETQDDDSVYRRFELYKVVGVVCALIFLVLMSSLTGGD